MQWKTVDPPETLLEGSDPYFQWRLGVGAGRGAPDRWPVVLGLKEGVTALEFSKGAAWQSHVDVPDFYKFPIQGLEDARWCTARVEPEFFGILETNAELQRMISRIAILPPVVAQYEDADAALAANSSKASSLKYSGSGTVVIGIIDYGIAFAHERFRYSKDATRIEYLWVQDDPHKQPLASPGSGLAEARAEFGRPDAEASSQPEGQVAEKPVPYGREIRAASINQLLSATGGTVDEDALYRQAARQLGRRWLRSVSRPVAHGTHVMDLACGYDLTEAERGKRPIVCVQLPEATTADTSGENLDSYVLDGIRYILERADEIARRVPGREHLPVVINFSYGNVAGPHDGTSDLESAIDELIQKRRAVASLQPLEVVIPSGNSHLGRLHASIPFKAAGETVDLHWRVLPDDRTPSFLEIWLPPGSPAREGNSRIKLAIATPGRLRSTSLDDTKPDGWLDDTKPGAGLQLLSDHGEVLCEARYRYVGKPTDRGMFLIALQPTRSNELAANPIAPSGTWIVTLENTRPEAYPVEAWIQRDDTPYGFPRRGRQSHFDEACYQRFFDVTSKDRLEHKDRPDKVQGQQIDDDDDQMDCIIKRAGSINAIATGRETIVVGGYLRKEMRVARYSAGGPKEPASSWKRDGPDALEVSDDSIVHRGVLGAGTRSGSVVALNGTSVAAPQVTRLVADQLGKGKSAQVGQQAARGRDIVKRRAQHNENQHADGKRPRKERGGAGRIMRPRAVQMQSLSVRPGSSVERGNSRAG